MHELVPLAAFAKPAQQVHHQPRHARAQPDVAVGDPDDVSPRLAVGAAHVADLGVRAEGVVLLAIF